MTTRNPLVMVSGRVSELPSGDSLTGYVRSYATDVGDGSSTSITVTHNLGTKDVVVCLYSKTSPYAEFIPDVDHTSTTALTLVFASAPTSAQYRCVVMG